jgi:hypothetical protein
MRKILLLWISLLSSLLLVRNQANNEANANNKTTLNPDKYLEGNYLKTAPSMIPEMSRNTSKCFTDLENVMGYFSDYEQAALVLAANSNNQTDRCFDCEIYAKYLPTAIQRSLLQMSNQITKNREKKRNGFGCFLNFTMPGMEPLINSSLSETVLSYLFYYSETNICISKFFRDIGQILIERRRFLCTTISNMQFMALNDTNGKIVGFKWTQPHANNTTYALVQLAGCINKERAIIPQTTVNAMSTIALSETCHVSARNMTNSGPLPEGRRLFSTLRFLQENRNITNATTRTNATQPVETATTSPTNATTRTNANQPVEAAPTSPTNATQPSNNRTSEAETPGISNNKTDNNTSPETNRTSTNTTPSGNRTAEFVSSAGNFNTLTITPAIPDLLLLTPGSNKINSYLNLKNGNKKTPVVIHNLLNYTSDDSQIYQSISDLLNATTTKNNSLYTDLRLNLKQSLLSSNYTFQCMPKGASIFLLNIQNSNLLLKEFQKTNCSAGEDYIITITNNTVKCENCDSSLSQDEIKFYNNTRVPKEYFFSTGCINGSRFKFATWQDITGIPFASYERDAINMNAVCLKKAFTCASNENAEFCPQTYMTPTCRTQLTNRCSSSGLFSTVQLMSKSNNNDFYIAEECSLEKLASLLNYTTSTNNNVTSSNMTNTNQLPQAYVNSCFNWILNNLFINAYNPNITKLSNLDTFFSSESTPQRPRRRNLQETSTTSTPSLASGQILIIPESEDPTRNDEVANRIANIAINSNSSEIDGMTAESNPDTNLETLLNNVTLSVPANETLVSPPQPRPQPQPQPQPEPQPLPNTPVYLNSNYLNVHTFLYSVLVIFLLIN